MSDELKTISIDNPYIAGICNEVTHFNTGAVRDIQEDKGRCDLMPCAVIAELYKNREPFIRSVFEYINAFIYTGEPDWIRKAIMAALNGNENWNTDPHDTLGNMLLDVSKHYKHGLEKYGERNWEKGIPLHSYIDSAIRHFIKWISGWDDERHDLAFMWNLMCCLHTLMFTDIPELFDLPYNTMNLPMREEK